jgi:hypothetical protein
MKSLLALSFALTMTVPTLALADDPFGGGVPPKPPGATPAETKPPAKKPEAKAPEAKPQPSGSGLLRPSTRRMLATAAIGPLIKLKDAPSQFGIELAFWYHLRGQPTGPSLGAALLPAFGNGWMSFSALGRFAWGFRPLPQYSLIIAPYVEAGWIHVSFDVCAFSGACVGGSDAFSLGLGVDARVTFNDRWVAFVRPISFGVYFGSETTSRYGLLFGGGASF